MIAGDKVDVAAEQRLLRRLRAVAEFETDFQPHLRPNTRLVHHLPNRQVRVRAIKTANRHRFLFRHFSLLIFFPRPRSYPLPLDGGELEWGCSASHREQFITSILAFPR